MNKPCLVHQTGKDAYEYGPYSINPSFNAFLNPYTLFSINVKGYVPYNSYSSKYV